MDAIAAIYLLAILLGVFAVGFCIGHVTGKLSERVTWWESVARTNRNAEAINAEPGAEPDFQWPAEATFLERDGDDARPNHR